MSCNGARRERGERTKRDGDVMFSRLAAAAVPPSPSVGAVPLCLDEPLPEELARLGHLGRDYSHAIRLMRIVGEIILMHGFSFVERGYRRNLGHDGIRPHLLGLQLCDVRARNRILLVIMRENHRTVLRAFVITLPVERGGVMDHEKYVEQVAERDLGWIEGDLHNLGVAGDTGAHLFIRRVGACAAGIAGDNGVHTAQLAVNRVETPEAAAAEGGSGKCRYGGHG